MAHGVLFETEFAKAHKTTWSHKIYVKLTRINKKVSRVGHVKC